MASRMERYNNTKKDQPTSRTESNQKLYEELYTSVSYTQFTKVDANVIDLDQVYDDSSLSRREKYQKSKGLSSAISDGSISYAKSYSSTITISDEKETRSYDINQVLEEAKKKRKQPDELEKKRKLRTTEYNILADLDSEKIKEYKEKKKEKMTKYEDVDEIGEEKEKLENLIEMVTPTTMDWTDQIDQDLLVDLMPTGLDETIVTQAVALDIDLPENQEKELENTEISETGPVKIDESFYTKSMDLSKNDFIPAEDDDEDEVEMFYAPERSKALGVVLIILSIIIIAIIVYIVYNVVK